MDEHVPNGKITEFAVMPCPCGTKRCGRVLLVMVRPVLMELEGSEDGSLASTAFLPVESIPEVIGKLSELYAGHETAERV